MSGSNRRLPMLPVCLGLVIGMGALACSKRDDDAARTSSEYNTATTPDGTRDTTTVTAPPADANVQADRSTTVATSEPARPRRSTARRSTPATTPDDAYAADREIARTPAPSSTDPVVTEDDRAAANRSAEQNRTGQVDVATSTTPNTSDSATRTQLENAGVLPKGPTLNDHQVINIVLLNNAGDSARAADILGDAGIAATPIASGDVAVGSTPAPPPPGEATVPVCDPDPEKAKECPTLPVAPSASASVTIETDQTKAPVTSYDEGRSVAPPAPGEVVVGEISMNAVRNLAQTMLRDHTSQNARAAAIAQSDNLIPTESALSVDVFNENREIKSEDVEDLSPAAREWLEREVRLHEEALAQIESHLLPMASDDELKALLEEERQKIQAHLTMARELLGSRPAATTTPVPLQPTTPDPNHENTTMPATPPAPADTIRTKPY